MSDPVTYTDVQATVIETFAPGERGSADCVLSIPLTNGAWELDIAMLADFGLTPAVGMAMSADVVEADRFGEDGQPNGRSVAVVGLRGV